MIGLGSDKKNYRFNINPTEEREVPMSTCFFPQGERQERRCWVQGGEAEQGDGENSQEVDQ